MANEESLLAGQWGINLASWVSYRGIEIRARLLVQFGEYSKPRITPILTFRVRASEDHRVWECIAKGGFGRSQASEHRICWGQLYYPFGTHLKFSPPPPPPLYLTLPLSLKRCLAVLEMLKVPVGSGVSDKVKDIFAAALTPAMKI